MNDSFTLIRPIRYRHTGKSHGITMAAHDVVKIVLIERFEPGDPQWMQSYLHRITSTSHCAQHCITGGSDAIQEFNIDCHHRSFTKAANFASTRGVGL